MSRFAATLDWLKCQTYLWRHERAMWRRVSAGANARVEYPLFKIEGPEYMEVGRNSSIGENAWLACYDRWQEQRFRPILRIGDDVRIGNSVCITVVNEVSIGDGCLFSDYVYISDHSHDVDPTSSAPLVGRNLKAGGSVRIGRNTFVGMRAIIMPGVALGEHSVVAAGAIVTKSFPAYSMVAGAPARLLKSFSLEKGEWLLRDRGRG
jgi:acetyltransferase-like isoleucine patch superfamily enzyme